MRDRSRCALVAFSALLTAVFWGALSAPVRAVPAEEDLESRVRNVFASRGDSTPAEIRNIDAAIAKKNPSSAFELATGILKRPEPPIARQREAYIKSLALLRRAQARRDLLQSQEQVNQDVLQAARLGNLSAINILLRAYVESGKSGDPASAVTPPGVDISEVIEIGLYLDDATSIRVALSEYNKGALSSSRRAFLELLLAYQGKDSGLLGKLNASGQKLDIGAVLKEHAIVGGVLSETKNRPFDRDVLATIAAESNLRGTLARGLGFTQPDERPDKDLSLREIIEMNAWVGEMSGMSTAYHLLAQETSLAHSWYIPRTDLIRGVRVGDTIHVRCGGLAHTAVVLGVDASRDELLLTDPLLQYWQPTHNTCITAFSEVHHRYGYYLARVKLSEVAEILDAVQGFGTFSPPAFARSTEGFRGIPSDAAPDGCASDTAAERGFLGRPFENIVKRDFFTFFNLREFKREQAGPGAAVLFLPAAPEFRGNVIVAVQTDARSCVRTFSTFVRRSFLEGRQSVFARDVILNFFRQSVGEEQQAALLKSKGQTIGSKRTSEQADFADVLSESAEGALIRVPGATLYAANVVAETGAKWIRMDLR